MAKWTKWVPIKSIPDNFYLISLVDTKDGLVLTFGDVDSEKQFVIIFPDEVLSYRNTDEGSLQEMLYDLQKNHEKEFYCKQPMFELEDSEYQKWFLNQSSGIYDKNEVKHYVFLTSDDVIEILSSYEPRFC